MGVNATETYKFKVFKAGELSKTFKMMLGSVGIDPEKIQFTATIKVDDKTSEEKELKIGEIGTICNIGENPKSITFGFHDDKSKWNFFILDKTSAGLLSLYVSTPSAELTNNLFSMFEKELNLEKMEPKKLKVRDLGNEFDELITRFEELEQKFSERDRKLRCFLSYKFNPKSKVLALELTRFLELMGVKVIAGTGYEPRRVSEKVLSRLENIDFIVYLITKEGESAWTRDEMAVSLGKGYNIIPLVENGAKLESGILGDWEHIPYGTDHIGDTFISIIEAINFIRNEKETKELPKK